MFRNLQSTHALYVHLYKHETLTHTVHRSQEHNRRCPPQLPQQPQVQANPHKHRHTISPRLHSRHHRRRPLLLRLEIRLGSQQALHSPRRSRLLRAQQHLHLLALVCRKGPRVRGRGQNRQGTHSTTSQKELTGRDRTKRCQSFEYRRGQRNTFPSTNATSYSHLPRTLRILSRRCIFARQ